MIIYILGKMLGVEGALLLIPAVVSLIYGEKTGISFLAVAAVLGVIYLVLGRRKPKNNRIYGKEGFAVVGLAWVLWSLFGALPFVISGTVPNYVDAFFETVSGFTTTGSTILQEIESLPRGINFWRCFTHWIGGMGVLVFVMMVTSLDDENAMPLMRAEVPGPEADKLVPKARSTARILYQMYFALTAVEVVLLMFGGMNLYELTGIDFLSGNYSENGGNGFRRNLSQSSVKDAPWAITDSEYERWGAQVFSSAPVVASTFNPDIMRELGEFVAIEGLYIGYPIVWGPGLNTHRHAYNGRNGEYYSEDPVLSGVCVMEYAVGSRDNGLVAAAKHYAFNDQETNRQGVSPFMTEQRAREIELRAYQIAIEAVKYNYYDADTDVVRGLTESGQKSNGLCGLMTSYSKVGPVEATCSRGMLTDILREEWGFTGYAVSDLNDDEDLFSSIVYAGLTGYDNRSANPDGQTRLTAMGVQSDSGSTPSGSYFAGDKLMQEQVKQSLKNTLWVVANSNMMNLYSATTHKVSVMVWWRQAYIAAITVTAILTAGAAAMYVVSVIKGRKEKN